MPALNFNADRLTPKEMDVLKEMAVGKSNKEICDSLHIASGTVKQHTSHIFHKLRVTSRSAAVAWAWQHGAVGESKMSQLMAYEILRLCPDCISPIERAADIGAPCVEHSKMISSVMMQLPLSEIIVPGVEGGEAQQTNPSQHGGSRD
jgi:DNA-binding CsgD family transcriptional regulator